MEQLEARLESIQRVDGDLYLVTISVTTDWPHENSRPPDQRLFSLVIDLDQRSMTPQDDLQEYFDVHYKFETSDGLNPRLRRQWKTASLVDGIVDIIFKSRLLIRWATLPTLAESYDN